MDRNTRKRPQVPGDSSCCTGGDGHQSSDGVRGAKNLRAGSTNRQTTMAHVLKDTDTLNVLTYNVRTLMKDERLIELEHALKDISWDIVGLAEVRREGEHTEDRDDGIFFHFGEINGRHGVGFMVAKKWKDNIIEFLGYSERVAVLKFQLTPNKTLTLIQVYAPTSTYLDDDVEDFYDLVNRACDENKGTWNLVLGDFNAKVGCRQALDSDDILGKFGFGDRNERGARLLQFAFGQSLNIANSLFFKKSQRRWTWVSPDSLTHNEIDYILSSDKQIINDVGVINKIKYSSDHRPIRAKIRFQFKIQRAKIFTKHIKRVTKHMLINNSDKFNLELSNYFHNLEVDETNPEEQYNAIVTGITNSTKKIKNTSKKMNKLTTETKILIEKRTKLAIGTEEYRKIDKEVKRHIRRDLRNLHTHLVKVALEKKTTLRILKQGVTKGKSWINSLKDSEGNKHYNRNKIMEIATNYYKALYFSENAQSDTVMDYVLPDTIPFINGQEVNKALVNMRYDRSPGEDGVTSEALKIGSPTLLSHITNLFNTILQSGKVPTHMCHSNIVLLHKKGDKSDISNYRPISLISHIYKAFIKVVQNRIDAKLDSHQPPEQAGFRHSFSTTDHLQTLNQLLEKYTEFNKPLYLAFVDYTKAFDSIKHTEIFTALQNQEINKTYIDILKNIYSNSTANIKLNSCGPSFQIFKGVKQGDPLSPKLFTSTLEEIFKTLAATWETRGIELGNKRLTNLRFADDIVIFAPSAPELQEMLQQLSTASLRVGLLMNRSKTQVMTNSIQHRVEVDGQVIQYVDEYIYLGQIVSFSNRQDKEIERRIENAWRSYWSMKTLMKGDLPLSLKRKLIDMCILPILTYGAQTWSLTESQKSKLGVCQRAMERSILGVTRLDRVRNTTLRSKTGIMDVGKKAAKLKWEWVGHVYRMHPDRWAKVTTQWLPENARRRRGRPRKRWRDDLDAYQEGWPDMAQDRDTWKDLGETFAQQWDSIG